MTHSKGFGPISLEHSVLVVPRYEPPHSRPAALYGSPRTSPLASAVTGVTGQIHRDRAAVKATAPMVCGTRSIQVR